MVCIGDQFKNYSSGSGLGPIHLGLKQVEGPLYGKRKADKDIDNPYTSIKRARETQVAQIPNRPKTITVSHNPPSSQLQVSRNSKNPSIKAKARALLKKDKAIAEKAEVLYNPVDSEIGGGEISFPVPVQMAEEAGLIMPPPPP